MPTAKAQGFIQGEHNFVLKMQVLQEMAYKSWVKHSLGLHRWLFREQKFEAQGYTCLTIHFWRWVTKHYLIKQNWVQTAAPAPLFLESLQGRPETLGLYPPCGKAGTQGKVQGVPFHLNYSTQMLQKKRRAHLPSWVTRRKSHCMYGLCDAKLNVCIQELFPGLCRNTPEQTGRSI